MSWQIFKVMWNDNKLAWGSLRNCTYLCELIGALQCRTTSVRGGGGKMRLKHIYMKKIPDPFLIRHHPHVFGI